MKFETWHKIGLGIVLTIFSILTAVDLDAQKIENVYPDIANDQIYIYYSLSGVSEDQSVLITAYMSTDGGETYGNPLKSVSGDVGLVTGPGKDKKIVWDVFNDLDELVSVNVKFKVKAELLGSSQVSPSVVKSIKLNLNSNLGYRGPIKYNSIGVNAKACVYFDRFGVGLRGDYIKTFREDINYIVASVVYPDTGYFWGYSGGAVMEYDLLKSEKYSLYPFLYVGQAKFLYTYNPEYRNQEYFKYSLYGSLGVGFDIKILKSLCLGLEMEYYISPLIDLIPSQVPDEALDGLCVGFIVKYFIEPD